MTSSFLFALTWRSKKPLPSRLWGNWTERRSPRFQKPPGLFHLKGMTKLEWLALDSTKVTDAGLEHLKVLTKLDWLQFRNTKVTAAGIKQLQQALPNCKIDP